MPTEVTMNVHLLNLLGLFMGGLGALILVFCPPPVPEREIMPNGTEKIPQTYTLNFPPTKKEKWKYYTRRYGFRFGVGLLLVGFLLQFIAELAR